MGNVEILLPFMRQVTNGKLEKRSQPYELTGHALNRLHESSHEKIKALFPDWPPYETVKRINRELEALWESPYAYGLLVVSGAVERLEKLGITAKLTGPWQDSYYAYLMGMTDREPQEGPATWLDRPLQLQTDDEQACREALLLAAWKYGLYVRQSGPQDLLLLEPDLDTHPQAPVIRLLTA